MDAEHKFLEIIELMPGYISVVGLDLRYIAVNPGLKKFASARSLDGLLIDCEVGCDELPNRMKLLINSPVGTECRWIYRQEKYLKIQSLSVVSKRYKDFILNVATDISEVKSNEERLFNILNTLPGVLEKNNNRRGLGREVGDLINSLIADAPKPSATPPKEDRGVSLVEIEVLTKQSLAKYSQLERDIFIEKDSLSERLSKLEVHQSKDDDAWGKFADNKEQIQKLASLAEFFNNIPGGKKTLIILLIIINLLGSITANVVVKYFGISQLIPANIKELIK